MTLVGAGVTLHNCLTAADQLRRDGIRARVVDLYSVKRIDAETLVAAVAASGDRVVVVEDHYPTGGIGSAVFEGASVTCAVAAESAPEVPPELVPVTPEQADAEPRSLNGNDVIAHVRQLAHPAPAASSPAPAPSGA